VTKSSPIVKVAIVRVAVTESENTLAY
jgi:hypothetical protein